MMHEFVTYSDGTLVVSSDIRKKDNGEEYIIVCFERPTENVEPIHVHICKWNPRAKFYKNLANKIQRFYFQFLN